MEELRKYIENNYYYLCDVSDKLIELSNLELIIGRIKDRIRKCYLLVKISSTE